MPEQAIALSREQLLRVLELARMAPSGANGQPWHFEWDGRELRVFFERHRTPGAVDADGRGTWIIVGTFLECLEIAAGRDGLGIAYRILSPYADDRPVAVVTFSDVPGPRSQGGLASTLAARFTDRRRYRGGRLESPALTRILEEQVGCPGQVRFLDIDRCPSRLVDYLAKCERLMWSWARYRAEVAPWWRWSKSERDRTRDGMHWASLGVNYLGSRLIKFVASSPPRGTFANRLGFTMLVERNARSLLLSSAGLGLTTVNSPRIEDLVSMMRLFMRSWLLLQQAGLAVQPMILSVLYSYFEKCGCPPDDLPPDFVALFRQGDRLVREAFACPQDEMPLTLCRVGVAPGPFPEDMRTLRRDIEPLVRFTPATAPPDATVSTTARV